MRYRIEATVESDLDTEAAAYNAEAQLGFYDSFDIQAIRVYPIWC